MDDTETITSEREALTAKYGLVRHHTESLCVPLATDDYQIQSIVQTSPPKWHLAHVTWYFEAFVLSRFYPGYIPFNPQYDYIFNSYYYTHGDMFPRPRRGILSRPTVDEVYDYRAYVDKRVQEVLECIDHTQWHELAFYLTLGLNHEQQHQELLLMDIKHNFYSNPLSPVYRSDLDQPRGEMRNMRWLERAGGIKEIGHSGKDFAYDNETPRHEVLLHDHRVADRFVTNDEYRAFMDDGGYDNPALWLSDGWELIHAQSWRHPLYWRQIEETWEQFTLGGWQPLNPHEPVCHMSFYEADAYARWAGKRLPLEEELEDILTEQPVKGNFADSDLLHPAPAGAEGQWFGDLWAWTISPYTGYPGYTPWNGSAGEYNGKFMSNQRVLKGGSCATPGGHTRASYRNFFYPDERWAFTGLRLAEDA